MRSVQEDAACIQGCSLGTRHPRGRAVSMPSRRVQLVLRRSRNPSQCRCGRFSAAPTSKKRFPVKRGPRTSYTCESAMSRTLPLLACLLAAAALLPACSAKDLSEFNAGGSGGGGANVSGGAAGSGGSAGASGGAAGSGAGGSAGTASGGSAGTASGGGAGTGGGSGGGTGGSDASPCEDLCDEIAKLACPQDNPATCRPDCEAQYAVCKPEYDALIACVQNSGSLSCDSDGNLSVAGCGASLGKTLVCAACTPSVSATSCEVCQAKNCCPETKQFVADPHSDDLTTCTDACATGSDSCVQACIQQFPEAGAKAVTLYQCISAACSVECD